MNKLIYLICGYIGILITFLIWLLKIAVDRNSLQKAVNKGQDLTDKIDDFENEMQNIKNRLDKMNVYNMTNEDIDYCRYISLISPVMLKYKNHLSDEMEKHLKILEKKSITLNNTINTANIFLKIISFGMLEIH